MILNIIVFIVIALLFFGIGFIVGERNANKLPFKEKEYSIIFEKARVDNYRRRDSFIIKELTAFCDQLGIKIKDLKLDDLWECKLVVSCSKDQYFLLVQEMSDFSKYWLDIKKITN